MKQKQKIFIHEPVQMFRAEGDKLVRAGFIDIGSHFFIGDPVIKTWDHHDQHAVPLTRDGQEFFILVRELSEEQQRLIIAFTVH